MRLAGPALRLVAAVALLAAVTWPIVVLGILPLSPHAMPIGNGRWRAQVLGVLWWIAVAASASGFVSFAVAASVATGRSRGGREVRLISDAAGIVAFGIAAISMSAFVFELPVSTVFATSSVLAVILGFALQNTIGDLLSGFAMSIEQPFRLGDRIALDERTTGRVVEMNWRATRLLTVAGDLIIVPNSILSRMRVTNHDTKLAAHHRYSVEIRIANDIEPARVSDILRIAAQSAAGVLPLPAPRVEVAASGDGWIAYKVLFCFTDWGDDTLVASRVLTAAWTHLSWAGVALPVARTVIERSTRVRSHDAAAPLVALISRVSVFEALDNDERLILARALRPRSLKRGDNVIVQDAEGQSLFIVSEGAFAVRVRDGATQREVAQLYPGDYVGEASLLTGVPRNASITAKTDGAVYEIDRSDFAPLLLARPAMAEALGAALAEREAARHATLATGAPVTNARLAHFANQIRTFFRR